MKYPKIVSIAYMNLIKLHYGKYYIKLSLGSEDSEPLLFSIFHCFSCTTAKIKL